jgi:TRAP-type uncharacterized transport system fused permease subunit
MALVEPAAVESAAEERARRTGVSRGALRIVAWVWIALLVAGSLQPARPGIVKGLHREIHWAGFAGAALLLFALSKTRFREILGACTILLLGVSLEVVQHLIYRNHLEWRDVVDDGFATLAAFALYRLTGAWKPRPEARP